RLVDGQLLNVRQSAREEDVDPLSLGGSLVVRVKDEQGELPLVDQFRVSGGAFTPNGDGSNDEFVLSYALLKLTQPATASLDIYDLGGRRVRHVASEPMISGRRSQVWDGRSEEGGRVLPGLYLWRLRLEADAGAVERQGVVGVAY
ncbi:MAG TPA: hypothetical protein EYG11_17145, partial [Candidatus Latescibacteria bacterium]|nr:hypothetical protein [Candidatus Latescibacterota bacterium]